jgi:hypothetical protein
MNAQKKRLQVLQQCDDWNSKHSVGTLVYLQKDDGTRPVTRTRSQAIESEAGYPVLWLEGVPGYYLLDRVTPVEGVVRSLETNSVDEAAIRRTFAAMILAAGGSVRVSPAIMQKLSAETRIGQVDSIDGVRTFYIERP